MTTTTTVTSITNTPANASVSVSEITDTVFIEGDLIPTANVTYDLGNATNYWNNLFLSGNTIYLGPLQLKAASATTFAVFQADGTTQANIDAGAIDVSAITSGTSTIGISGVNGNAFITVGGTANVLVVGQNAANVTGTLGVSGNITAPFFLGIGSQLTGIDATQIQNGTSNVKVPSSGSNVTISVAGTPNVAVITATGANIAGTLNATGNANVANIGATNAVFTNIAGLLTTAAQTNITSVGTLTSLAVTGNISGANLNVTGDIVDTGAMRLITAASGNVSLAPNGTNVIVATTTGANITGTLNATGNANLGNIGATNVVLAGALSGVTTISASGNANVGNVGATNAVFTNISGTLTTAAQTNITSVGTLTSLSVSGAVTGASLSVSTGNITGGNLLLSGAIEDSAQLDIRTTASNGNIVLTPNGTGVVVAAKDIVNGQANGVGNIGSATGFFNTVFAKATSAQYADLAEKYVADADYAVGTLLIIGGDAEVTQSKLSHSTAVVGTVSENPATVMNAGLESSHVAVVALVGRVPCKVIGSIRKGDLLASSTTPGVAMALDQLKYRPGCVVGKALQNYDSDQEGTIEILVGRL